MLEQHKTALILIIDSEELICEECRQELSKPGFEIAFASKIAEGIRLAREKKPDMVFIDLNMTGADGINALKILTNDIPDIVIVVTASFATIDSAVKAIKDGAYDYLSKPFMPEQLRAVVDRCLEHRTLKIEARKLREERDIFEKGFITFVSHEMRSPLVTVQQYFESLKVMCSKNPDPKIDEIISRCSGRIKNLEDLVSHWLDLERISRKSFTDSMSPVSLPSVIKSAFDDLSPISDKRGIVLRLEEPPSGLPDIMGDSESLIRVFINIIGNATKYTGPGGSITSRLLYDDYYVVAEITDTGRGIPPDKLQFIFEPFFRVLGSKEPYKGSGLGLTFCKKIMDAHNGRIEVSSKVGTGTTFLLKFPR